MRSRAHVPGWKTTEFWLSTLGSAVTMAGALVGALPAAPAVIVAGSVWAAYTGFRAFTKAKSGDVAGAVQDAAATVNVINQTRANVEAVKTGQPVSLPSAP